MPKIVIEAKIADKTETSKAPPKNGFTMNQRVAPNNFMLSILCFSNDSVSRVIKNITSRMKNTKTPTTISVEILTTGKIFSNWAIDSAE